MYVKAFQATFAPELLPQCCADSGWGIILLAHRIIGISLYLTMLTQSWCTGHLNYTYTGRGVALRPWRALSVLWVKQGSVWSDWKALNLEQCFSNFNMPMSHAGTLIRGRLRFSGSGVGSRTLYFWKLLGNVDAAGQGPHLEKPEQPAVGRKGARRDSWWAGW